jgi:hypothetical protein
VTGVGGWRLASPIPRGVKDGEIWSYVLLYARVVIAPGIRRQIDVARPIKPADLRDQELVGAADKLAPSRTGVLHHQRRVAERADVRTKPDYELEACKRARWRHVDEKAFTELGLEADVCVVESERVTDLVRRDRQEVDAQADR